MFLGSFLEEEDDFNDLENGFEDEELIDENDLEDIDIHYDGNI